MYENATYFMIAGQHWELREMIPIHTAYLYSDLLSYISIMNVSYAILSMRLIDKLKDGCIDTFFTYKMFVAVSTIFWGTESCMLLLLNMTSHSSAHMNTQFSMCQVNRY